MKKYTVLFCIIIFLSLMVSCTENKEVFDDEKIIFELVNAQSNNELQSNTIKITNETGFDLANLSMRISHPLSEENSDNSNNEIESFEFMEDFNIKSGEAKEFSIPLTLKEGIEAIDLEMDLEGNVVARNEQIPFEIAGSLRALVATP